jgi:phosphoribosylanthranilate isomerase
MTAVTAAVSAGVKVKVCGVTDPANALAAAGMGADYLGLNFYPGSPRCVDLERAVEIAEAVRGRTLLVGVFVDAPGAEVERIAGRVGLDLVQFSGSEGPDEVAPFAGRAIKAFRSGGMPSGEELDAYGALWGVLIDAPHARLYGGTGIAWDYGSLAGSVGGLGEFSGRRLFLAGGLGPDNVRSAVAAARPWAVDVCSRVESAPGIKDLELLRRLFQEVRHHGETPTPP